MIWKFNPIINPMLKLIYQSNPKDTLRSIGLSLHHINDGVGQRFLQHVGFYQVVLLASRSLFLNTKFSFSSTGLLTYKLTTCLSAGFLL